RQRWFWAGLATVLGALLVTGLVLGRGPQPAVALAAGEEGGEESGTITVSGQATVRVVPDTASLSLGVQAQAATAAEAMAECSQTMNRVVSAVISAGVPRENVQTTNISLSPQYEYDEKGSGPRVVGYQASSQVAVTWNKLDRVGSLIDAAVKAGANLVYGISFSLADPKPVYLQAVGEAVRDARAKADALAAAAGVRVGSVKKMSLDSYWPGPVIMREAKAQDLAAALPVEPGMIELQVTVHVEYGIR
ncbi:MAG: SIMPL domain-containing protein, partial [Firmicutes bacterium]|nr:SIMPL domain-containing protein [Bacillota bacterium]